MELGQHRLLALAGVCSGCGRITDIPWLLLLRRPGISRDSFIGSLPLRCQHCGSRQSGKRKAG